VVVVFSALNVVGGFVGNRLLTEAVPPATLGQYYLLTNLALWLTLPTASAFVFISRHWPVARIGGAVTSFVRGLGLGLVAQALVAGLGVVAIRSLGLASGAGLTTWAVAGALWIVCVSQAICQALDPIQSAERRRTIAGVLGLMGTPLRQILLAAAALVLVPQAGTLLGVHAAASTMVSLATIVALRVLLRDIPRTTPSTAPSLDIGTQSLLWHIVPYFFTALLTQVSSSAERWGLAKLADPSTTAIFVQALGLSSASIGAAITAPATYFQPIITQAASRAGTSPLLNALIPIRRYVMLVASILAVGTIGAAVLADVVTSILFGAKYVAISGLLPWTVLGAALFSLAQVLAIVPSTARDTISPNVARVVSLLIYTTSLLSCRAGPGENLAEAFARIYVISNGLYLLGMIAVSARLVRRATNK